MAQIITYGKMAAKSSIRDMGRVLDVPLSQVDALASSIYFTRSNFFFNSKRVIKKVNRDDVNKVQQLMDSINKNQDELELMNLAQLTEEA